MPYRDYRITFEAYLRDKWRKDGSLSVGKNAGEAIRFWKKNKQIKLKVRNVKAKRLKTYYGRPMRS